MFPFITFCFLVLWLHQCVVAGASGWKDGGNPAGLRQLCLHLLQTQADCGEGQRVANHLPYSGYATGLYYCMLCYEKKAWNTVPAVAAVIHHSCFPLSLGSPRLLKHLCRLAIRSQMSPRTLADPKTMDSIPLPRRLKNYVMYKEHDLYNDIICSNEKNWYPSFIPVPQHSKY